MIIPNTNQVCKKLITTNQNLHVIIREHKLEPSVYGQIIMNTFSVLTILYFPIGTLSSISKPSPSLFSLDCALLLDLAVGGLLFSDELGIVIQNVANLVNCSYEVNNYNIFLLLRLLPEGLIFPELDQFEHQWDCDSQVFPGGR